MNQTFSFKLTPAIARQMVALAGTTSLSISDTVRQVAQEDLLTKAEAPCPVTDAELAATQAIIDHGFRCTVTAKNPSALPLLLAAHVKGIERVWVLGGTIGSLALKDAASALNWTTGNIEDEKLPPDARLVFSQSGYGPMQADRTNLIIYILNWDSSDLDGADLVTSLFSRCIMWGRMSDVDPDDRAVERYVSTFCSRILFPTGPHELFGDLKKANGDYYDRETMQMLNHVIPFN